MAGKHNIIYLFLALACFVGIILIFIFDGFIGLYDSLVIDNGQYQQTTAADQWAQQAKFGGIVSTSVNQGGSVVFTYTVENHQFSSYNAPLDVSLWYNRVKTTDVLSEQLSLPTFGKRVTTWTINADDILPPNFPTNQNYDIILKITLGNIERDVSVNVFNSSALKTIPPVPTITIPAPAPRT
jgi:hypothetical protein